MVEYLSYKEKKLPICLNLDVFEKCKKELPEDFDEFDATKAIFENGLREGHKKRKVQFDFSDQELRKILDYVFPAFLSVLSRSYQRYEPFLEMLNNKNQNLTKN